MITVHPAFVKKPLYVSDLTVDSEHFCEAFDEGTELVNCYYYDG